ncbi:MAG: hypothetical protein R2882_08800 [Gemmatimonadales bacterium]
MVLYPLALTLSVGVFLFFLGTKQDTDVTPLRGIGAPYSIQPTAGSRTRFASVTNRGRTRGILI